VTVSAPGGGTPTGTVTFRDGSTTLGTGTLSGGQARFTTSSLSVGTHTITAVYGGDSNFSGSTSAPLTQTVNQAAMPANRRLVGQFYQDLLGRAADPAGLDFFTGLLDRNSMTRTQVAMTIVTSLEGRQKQVQDTYSTLLGRAAEPAGLNHWVAFLLNGGSPARMRSLFVSSPEYFQHAGGTNSGFVDALFRDVMNRSADPAARAATIAALDGANGRRRDTFRRQVVDMIFASDEPRQAAVQGFYQKFLARAADGAGLGAFTNLLRMSGRDELVILTLVASDEYSSRIPS
jgi:hypothetical protein